jgi:hypothetical protein
MVCSIEFHSFIVGLGSLKVDAKNSLLKAYLKQKAKINCATFANSDGIQIFRKKFASIFLLSQRPDPVIFLFGGKTFPNVFNRW